jgi:hypothetical protein
VHEYGFHSHIFVVGLKYINALRVYKSFWKQGFWKGGWGVKRKKEGKHNSYASSLEKHG